MMRWAVGAFLLGPVFAGLIGVALPAFGYFPAAGQTHLSLDPIRALFAWNGVWFAAFLSLFTGLLSALISTALALGIVAALSNTKLWQAVQGGLGPILALPHVAIAFGLAFLIAPSGWIARLIAPALGWDNPPDVLILNDPFGLSLVAALVVKEVPFLLLMIVAAIPQVQPEKRLRVTSALGYGRLIGWTMAVWPDIYRQIRLPVLLVLTFSMSVVDVSLILGPTTPPTLSVLILKWMGQPDLGFRMQAAAAALFQLGISGIGIGMWIGIEMTAKRVMNSLIQDGRRLAIARLLEPVFVGCAYLLSAGFVASIAVLILWSFAGFWGFPDIWPDSISLHTWGRFAASLIDVTGATVRVALPAAILSVIVAIALFESGKILPNRLLFGPLIVPQVAFLPGVQVLMLQVGVRGGYAAVLLAHMIFVLPYVILTLGGAYRAWNPNYGHVASALGKSPIKVFFAIRLPMLLGPILVAFAIGVAVSVGQYLPTLLIGGGRIATLTTEAVALASGGDRRAISVFALGQAGAAVVPFVLAVVIPMIVWRNRRGMVNG